MTRTVANRQLLRFVKKQLHQDFIDNAVGNIIPLEKFSRKALSSYFNLTQLNELAFRVGQEGPNRVAVNVTTFSKPTWAELTRFRNIQEYPAEVYPRQILGNKPASEYFIHTHPWGLAFPDKPSETDIKTARKFKKKIGSKRNMILVVDSWDAETRFRKGIRKAATKWVKSGTPTIQEKTAVAEKAAKNSIKFARIAGLIYYTPKSSSRRYKKRETVAAPGVNTLPHFKNMHLLAMPGYRVASGKFVKKRGPRPHVR